MSFLRGYVMNFGGVVIGNTDPHALHIHFKVEKSDSKTPNTATIEVWNLSKASIDVLDTKDCEVQINAGYLDEGYGTVIKGNVTTVETTKDGNDRKTEINATDSRVILRDTYVSLAHKGATKTKVLINEVAGEMGVSVVFSPKCKSSEALYFPTLPNGFSFVGSAASALNKITKAINLVWNLSNGVLQILTPGEPIKEMAYVLSPETGLIDIPKKVTVSSNSNKTTTKKTATKEKNGWEVKYFLNPAIDINDKVQIKSDEVNGTFRVRKITYDADNMSGDWACTAEVVEAGT